MSADPVKDIIPLVLENGFLSTCLEILLVQIPMFLTQLCPSYKRKIGLLVVTVSTTPNGNALVSESKRLNVGP